MGKVIKVRRSFRPLHEGMKRPRPSSHQITDPFSPVAAMRPVPAVGREIVDSGMERALRTEASSYISDVGDLLRKLPIDPLVEVIDRLDEARWREQLVFVCGNGGSAATAIHFASDLAKGATAPGKPEIKALCLCENISLVTAWANDASYGDVFTRRMDPWLKAGDVLIAISCSGNSQNVLNAIYRAKGARATTIGLTGADGGKLRTLVDLWVAVPSDDVEQIEDVHHTLCHLITSCLRKLPAGSQIQGYLQTDRGW